MVQERSTILQILFNLSRLVSMCFFENKEESTIKLTTCNSLVYLKLKTKIDYVQDLYFSPAVPPLHLGKLQFLAATTLDDEAGVL